MYDFLTIGSVTRDISFFSDEGLVLDNRHDLLRQQVLAFELGAKIVVEDFYYSFGGGAANSAVCLANFGMKVACLAPVGDDLNGQLILGNLRQRGVSTRLMQKVKGEASSFSFVLVTPSGERIIFVQRGANNRLQVGAAERQAVSRSKNIYIASLAGVWQPKLKALLSKLKPEQRVFWNPGSNQIAGGLDELGGLLPKISVFSVNQDEAIELVMRSAAYKKKKRAFFNNSKNLLQAIRAVGPRLVLITRGPEGVLAYDGQKFYDYPILKEQKRVDATGIGDVFNSSFAAGYHYYQEDIDKALRLALKNAAAKVSQRGAQNGLLDKQVLESLK